jgi:hypothetical protein
MFPYCWQEFLAYERDWLQSACLNRFWGPMQFLTQWVLEIRRLKSETNSSLYKMPDWRVNGALHPMSHKCSWHRRDCIFILNLIISVHVTVSDWEENVSTRAGFMKKAYNFLMKPGTFLEYCPLQSGPSTCLLVHMITTSVVQYLTGVHIHTHKVSEIMYVNVIWYHNLYKLETRHVGIKSTIICIKTNLNLTPEMSRVLNSLHLRQKTRYFAWFPSHSVHINLANYAISL